MYVVIRTKGVGVPSQGVMTPRRGRRGDGGGSPAGGGRRWVASCSAGNFGMRFQLPLCLHRKGGYKGSQTFRFRTQGEMDPRLGMFLKAGFLLSFERHLERI